MLLRSSAARAAHRELRSLLRLFRANYSWGICARTPWCMARYRVVRARRSRAPVTGVTGQLFLWDIRANALVHGSISRRTSKAVARACHWRFWPIIPMGYSRERPGAWLDIASYEQGGRARLSQALLANYSYGIFARTPWCMARYRVVRARRSRAPVTGITGQLFLWDIRANALVHGSISRRTSKAVARACHRRYWPETNVGASAARDAPRGRRSISATPHNPRQAQRLNPQVSRSGPATAKAHLPIWQPLPDARHAPPAPRRWP
ncbi:hypothetical protein PshuTeo2_00700 [Pseudomonas hunanensis]|nr:hypothetical protein [Pseudomonas hunanensis]